MEKKLLIVKLSPYKIDSLMEFCRLEDLTPDKVVGSWISSLHDQLAMKESPVTRPLYDAMVQQIRGCND